MGIENWSFFNFCVIRYYTSHLFHSFLHASAHFCTATVEAIEADKGMLRVRSVWVGT